MNDAPESPSDLPAKDATGAKLAWAALITSILSWPATPVLPVVFDAAAIICGILALSRLPRHQKKHRNLAWAGFVCLIIKYLAGVLLMALIFFAFARNPVAH